MTKTIVYTDGGCSRNYQPDFSKREMIAVVTDLTGAVLGLCEKFGSDLPQEFLKWVK